jgi:hypothetical protein
VSVQVELLKDGKAVGSHVYADPDELYGEAAWDISEDIFIHGDVASEVIDRQGVDHLSVRITGVVPMRPVDPRFPGGGSIPSNQWCRTRYWCGSFTVPLSEVLPLRPDAPPAAHSGSEMAK